jgi:hypothetical protein
MAPPIRGLGVRSVQPEDGIEGRAERLISRSARRRDRSDYGTGQCGDRQTDGLIASGQDPLNQL